MDGTGQRLYRHARTRIPGGTQLLSKRPELFLPEQWPAYFSRAKGARVWDLDGNEYVDMSYNGIGANVLGAADPEVDAAVIGVIERGTSSTLNAPEEVELADLLCEIHPWADMVRYARCGGEAMAVAVRIARTHTRREKVAFCGYHGWHDWYLAANLSSDRNLDGHLIPGLQPGGVPRGLLGTALPFHHNRLDELERVMERNKGEIAAIVMEPMRSRPPTDGFLEGARRLADDNGAVLVFDEITTGFRLNEGGVHLRLGVQPDMAVFAKAMSNGYPMAAIIGTREVMESAQSSFISSTYWTDRVGPAAAIATIRKFRERDVGKQLSHFGKRVKTGWLRAAKDAGITVSVDGMDPLAHFSFELPEAQSAHTFFTQHLLERGYLAGKSFYATFAHDDAMIDEYLCTVADAFTLIAKHAAEGNLASVLKGPIAHTGFRRLT